jgi:transposase
MTLTRRQRRSPWRCARRFGHHVAILVERVLRDRPHPEQGYRSALGVLSLEGRFGRDRLKAASDRAQTYNTVSYASVQSILTTGLDHAVAEPDSIPPPPRHDNIRRAGYY